MESKKGNEEVEALKEDIARLREDIASLASAVLDAASDKLDDAKAQVNSKSHEAQDELKGKINAGVERGKQFMGDLDAQVSRHPVGSVLVAFGVGLLVAKILGSGNNR